MPTCRIVCLAKAEKHDTKRNGENVKRDWTLGSPGRNREGTTEDQAWGVELPGGSRRVQADLTRGVVRLELRIDRFASRKNQLSLPKCTTCGIMGCLKRLDSVSIYSCSGIRIAHYDRF